MNLPVASRAIRVLLIVTALSTCGCSISYDLHLEGRVLKNGSHSPVEGATITLFAGKHDYARASSDKDGRWGLVHRISDGEFWADDNGRPRLTGSFGGPYMVRVEVRDETYTIPCPRVFEPESGNDIFASVLTVLRLDDVARLDGSDE